MRLPRLPLAILLTLIAIGGPAAALAQTAQARIGGVVRDGTSTVVPGVTVTATNQATKAAHTTTTGRDGTFSFSVAPGTYLVAASMFGFRTATETVEAAGDTAKPIELTLSAALSQEVTVTATKREQTVLDVPFSVAAPTEEVLRSRGATTLEDVAANVGGFTVQNLGPGQTQVAMRGVSAGQIVRDQPGVKEQVGVYLDESVVSMSLFTPDLDLFDTNRVEVLRGPQGTLFGSGSLSGTVRYITNQPEMGRTKGFVELDGGGLTGGGATGYAKFGFNVPMGEKAAARVVSYFDRLPGFTDAVQPDLSLKKDVNGGSRNGVRGAVRIAPNTRLSFTPRVAYQRVSQDGWNRNDIYNILANPYTLSRPAVTLGEREQFTQLQEEFTDDFTLADLALDYNLGKALLTSTTSYNRRSILVVRDATALTASITGGTIGLPQSIYTLNAPLNDKTKADAFTQEVRLSGVSARVSWVAGGFFGRSHRHYGQDLPVIGFQDATGIPTQGLRAPKDSLFWSDLDYKLNQVAIFGEATLPVTDQFSVTAGLRGYHFDEDKEQIFDGIFAQDNTGTALVSQPGTTDANGVAPRLIGTWKLTGDMNVNAQVSKGFRLGGINDPLNVPLCTPQDLVTFGGRETWKDETVWNYEGGIKAKVLNGTGAFAASVFYMDIHDLQATVTAGSCSSRVVFNVPKARSQGIELEFEDAPNRHISFALSASFNDSELRSTLTSTDASGNVSVVSGIESGERLPTVPKVQLAAAATYQWDLATGTLGYVTGVYRHVGSRLTQVGDQNLGTLDLISFGGNTIGQPLTALTFTYDPLLPSYDLLNLRAGVRRSRWDVSVYMNNVTNELARLSLDQERGTRARISYLNNPPRAIGVTTRFDF
jgi:iron complex outermembrane receptor protein